MLVGPFDPPVPIEDIAQAAGISTISVAPLRRQSAVLMAGHGTLGIILNRDDPPVRRRFSIAHELGHIVIAGSSGVGNLAPAAHRGQRDTQLERACDYFAACLLMPRRWVIDAHRETPLVRTLARTFDVSPTTMTHRLRELGLE